MQWALDYAAASRARMVEVACAVIEPVLGAISARDGEPGIIPGSTGAPSFHVTES